MYGTAVPVQQYTTWYKKGIWHRVQDKVNCEVLGQTQTFWHNVIVSTGLFRSNGARALHTSAKYKQYATCAVSIMYYLYMSRT